MSVRATVPNVSSETNGTPDQASGRPASVPTVAGGTNGTRARYRVIAKMLGASVSTVWRAANADRPFLDGVRFTEHRERVYHRRMAASLLRCYDRLSTRQIAEKLGVPKSTIDRDLQYMATREARGENIHAEILAWCEEARKQELAS